MTAVEFLFEKLWETPKDKWTWQAIKKQALEMEKKQIVNAFNAGYTEAEEDNDVKPITGDLPVSKCSNASDYYNQTYGQ